MFIATKINRSKQISWNKSRCLRHLPPSSRLTDIWNSSFYRHYVFFVWFASNYASIFQFLQKAMNSVLLEYIEIETGCPAASQVWKGGIIRDLKKIHTESIIKRDNSIKPWYIHMNEIQGSARYTVLKVGYSAWFLLIYEHGPSGSTRSCNQL
jgi:hypothetical protein